jgi:hypothetical protein
MAVFRALEALFLIFVGSSEMSSEYSREEGENPRGKNFGTE